MFHIGALKEYLNSRNKTNKCTYVKYVLSYGKFSLVTVRMITKSYNGRYEEEAQTFLVKWSRDDQNLLNWTYASSVCVLRPLAIIQEPEQLQNLRSHLSPGPYTLAADLNKFRQFGNLNTNPVRTQLSFITSVVLIYNLLHNVILFSNSSSI